MFDQSTINTVENKSIFYRLNGIIQQYELTSNDLRSLDRYNDVCEIVLSKIVPIWKRFARDSKKASEKRNFLCEALNHLDQLTELLAERWRTIRQITSQHDVCSDGFREHRSSSFLLSLLLVSNHAAAHPTAIPSCPNRNH